LTSFSAVAGIDRYADPCLGWFVWLLVLIVKGGLLLVEHKPIANPKSWLFGLSRPVLRVLPPTTWPSKLALTSKQRATGFFSGARWM